MPDQAALRAAPQEHALVDMLVRLGKHRAGRLAVHIRLSNLSRARMRTHYIDLAEDMLTSALRAVEGQLFRLQNSDFVFAARDAKPESVDRAIDRLRALFSEDPIFAHKQPESFCVWYRFEEDYDALLTAAQEWLRNAERAQADYVRKDPLAGLMPIKPELLARLERTLAGADVTNLARRQVVCALFQEQPPQALFEEIYVSIPELQAQMTPGVNWLTDPWLFQYLTHTLDKRVMAMLTKKVPATNMPFSLNLHVASVLSPEFRLFDEIVEPQVRGRLVIEFNKLDVFADMGAFLFARDYLRERGYRLCLDGLTHLTLPYYSRTRLGFDLVKLFWRPDGIEDALPEVIPSLRDMIKEVGQTRVILCRCETNVAVTIGQRLGIVMFQGRYVDRLWAAAKEKAAAEVNSAPPLRA